MDVHHFHRATNGQYQAFDPVAQHTLFQGHKLNVADRKNRLNVIRRANTGQNDFCQF
jgi:hypothetical protein